MSGSIALPSPARRAFDAARALAARGFGVPEVVAAVEERRLGAVRRSFFVTREVTGAVTADRYWEGLAAGRPAARRRFAAWLGELFRRLHAAGVYHNDLKDVNVLVRPGRTDALESVLLDLERVRIGRAVSRRRRTKNLVQLDRTLGRAADATTRLRFLRAYLGAAASAAEVRAWSTEITAAAARKDRRAALAAVPARAGVACAVVCQDEAAHIGPCLESVAWCDEVVVVDGGSRDATVAIARPLATRVVENPWPGYRAQKQVALDATTEPWILSLDADERVTPSWRRSIRPARVSATASTGSPSRAWSRTSGAGGTAAAGGRGTGSASCVAAAPRGAASIHTIASRSAATRYGSTPRSCTTRIPTWPATSVASHGSRRWRRPRCLPAGASAWRDCSASRRGASCARAS